MKQSNINIGKAVKEGANRAKPSAFKCLTSKRNRKITPYGMQAGTFFACLILILGGRTSYAQQCNVLAMPKLIKACPGDVLPMPATLTGTNTTLSTTWTPASGLSSNTVLNPMLTVPATSGWYHLTVQTLVPGNLVTNGNFSSGNTGFTSSYGYVPVTSTALNPAGKYTICTNPSMVHTLAASYGDHTTGTGNMMAINGASTPDDVWCSTVNVLPNTDYAFSAWFANWSSSTSNPAQITFKINGTLLSSTPFTFPPTSGLWSPFTSTWNSGSTSGTINICIYDQQIAFSGNDFTVDDVSFQKVCILTDSIYVDVTCPPSCNSIQLPDSIVRCIGDSTKINAQVDGQDSILDVSWTPSTGLSSTTVLTPTLTGTTSGWYHLTVKSLLPGNLVANGDFGAGNTAFTSSYTYVPVSSTALNPAGVYTICTNPSMVHTLAASFGDHTTGTGNMMAINGASAPDDVWCSTVNVSPNTDYAFSAWFANWSSSTSNLPQITFKINGTLLSSTPFNLPATSGQWKQFFSTWNSGSASGAVTICIYDQQIAFSGNDFVIDDVSFQKICISEDSVYVMAKNCSQKCADRSSIKYVRQTNDDGSCFITATADVSSSYHILGYQWSGAGSTVTHYNHTGSDSYSFTVPAGSTVSLSCLIYLVDTTLQNPQGPCCQVELNQKISCDGKEDPKEKLIGLNQNYRLFPNPTNGSLNIIQAIPDENPVRAVVLDSDGKTVYKNNLSFSGGTKAMKMHLAPGLYIMQLIDRRGESFALKFVVDHSK